MNLIRAKKNLDEILNTVILIDGPGFAQPSTADYMDFGVANVYDFHKSDDPASKIQLVVSHYSPLEPILRFHSSTLFLNPSTPPLIKGIVPFFRLNYIISACVMNLISHEKAYSLYPRGTFKERRSFAFQREGLSEEAAQVAREKYIARGWNMVQSLTSDDIVDRTSAFSFGVC